MVTEWWVAYVTDNPHWLNEITVSIHCFEFSQ